METLTLKRESFKDEDYYNDLLRQFGIKESDSKQVLEIELNVDDDSVATYSYKRKLTENQKELSFDYIFCDHCLIHVHQDKFVYKNDQAHCPNCDKELNE